MRNHIIWVDKRFRRIPRLPEFENSCFYSTDFNCYYFKFLTIYDRNMNLLGEYAHISVCGKYNKWVKPDDTVITTGILVTELEKKCYKHGEILLDLYVDDIFKPNPNVKRKIIFQYRMVMNGKTGFYKKGVYIKNTPKYAYSVESVDDVKCFHSIEQVIGNQNY